jgi:ABC-type sugar transport system ATPase subunit
MSTDHSQSFLEMRNVSKTFGRIRALTGVSLDVRLGEIHALMGENGAGKSTLMKVLSGAYMPDEGSEILIEGRKVAINGPQAARQLGIAIIYQELALAPKLTVAENIYLGRETKKAGLIDREAMVAGVESVLQRLGATFTAISWRICRLPSANWWKSAGRCTPAPGSSSWTNPHDSLGARNRAALRPGPPAQAGRPRRRLHQPSHERGLRPR